MSSSLSGALLSIHWLLCAVFLELKREGAARPSTCYRPTSLKEQPWPPPSPPFGLKLRECSYTSTANLVSARNPLTLYPGLWNEPGGVTWSLTFYIKGNLSSSRIRITAVLVSLSGIMSTRDSTESCFAESTITGSIALGDQLSPFQISISFKVSLQPSPMYRHR